MRINPIKLGNILRGCSWSSDKEFSHTAFRSIASSYIRVYYLGFRIILKKVNNANKSN